MRHVLRLLGCLVGIAAARPLAGQEASPEVHDDLLASSLHPGVGSGDFEFYVDAAAIAPAAAGSVRLRVLVQFPLRRLLEDSDRDEANLRVQARVFAAEPAMQALEKRAAPSAAAAPDDEAARREAATQEDLRVHELLESFDGVEVLASAEDQVRLEGDVAKLQDTDYRLAELALDVPQGDLFLEVQVENLSRLKKGLLDKLRQRHQSATARLLVLVPDLQVRPALSDAVFLVGHGELQDYASRVYGLLNDSLHVRCGLWSEGPARLDVLAQDRSGDKLWQDSLQVDAGSREITWHTSVNTFPAGQYILTVTARTAAGVAVSRRSFDVAWTLSSWKKSRRSLDFEAETILTEEEFKVFTTLPLGEKERFMDEFWLHHDPTPETAHNELLAEFQRRVAYADAHFSESLRGASTHRGKVYIRFGSPDEVQAEALPSHLAGTGAEGLIEKIDDPYTTAVEEAMGTPGPTEAGTLRGAREEARLTAEHQRIVGPARELIAYELWIYAGRGDPLLERDLVATGFRLLFLDTHGYGQFLLRKSTAALDIPGLHAGF